MPPSFSCSSRVLKEWKEESHAPFILLFLQGAEGVEGEVPLPRRLGEGLARHPHRAPWIRQAAPHYW